MSSMSSNEWVHGAWKWATDKTITQASITRDHFPHVAEHGVYDRCDPQWWTAGFWPGLLWLVHKYNPAAADETDTKQLASQQLVQWAQSCERQLEPCLHDTEQVDHDLGFIWLLSGVAHYKQTGNAEARRRSLLAANLLAARFNVKGHYIRAWNFESAHMDTRGVAIIDSMMNLPLLYWASLETGDPRYHELATLHANTVAREFVRADHSICHVVEFDPLTGHKRCEHGGQGYAPGSAWVRGTAWALHGFALSYAYTRDARYLEISRQTASFFLQQMGDDIVPYWDFRAPEANRDAYDSSATAIAASGMLELAKYVDESESQYLQQAASRLISGLYARYSTRHSNEEGMITHGTVHYPENRQLNVPIIYGDYFFVEALAKLRGEQGLFTPGL